MLRTQVFKYPPNLNPIIWIITILLPFMVEKQIFMQLKYIHNYALKVNTHRVNNFQMYNRNIIMFKKNNNNFYQQINLNKLILSCELIAVERLQIPS